MSTGRHDPGQEREAWPPQPGFFTRSLTKKGWGVPARIYLWDDGAWQGELDGTLYDAHPDPGLAPYVADIWHYGFRIDETTYRHLLAMKEWAAANDRDHPCLHPRRTMDPRLLPPIMPRATRYEATPDGNPTDGRRSARDGSAG